jgi:hypothetical protein
MRDRRDEYALCDIGGDCLNAAELRSKAVAKSREINHILLRIEEPIGLHVPGDQARAVSIVGGVEDWKESDRASVADDFPQQSSMAIVLGVCPW